MEFASTFLTVVVKIWRLYSDFADYISIQWSVHLSVCCTTKKEHSSFGCGNCFSDLADWRSSSAIVLLYVGRRNCYTALTIINFLPESDIVLRGNHLCNDFSGSDKAQTSINFTVSFMKATFGAETRHLNLTWRIANSTLI